MSIVKVAVLAAAALGCASAARAQVRLPPVPPASYDKAQSEAAADYKSARGNAVAGPFAMLMRSPDLMSSARSMGDYLRFKSAIGTKLSELVILITAREWTQDYEWNAHAPIALQRGISQATVDAIADWRRPEAMSDDEAICYDFTMELQKNRRVSDATYQRVLKRFGERGVIDLTGVSGYYTFLAMNMTVGRMDPEGPLRLPRP